MSDAICPVCETANAPDATHCEVCGERLAPLQPGEVLAPEESVAAMMAEQARTPQQAGHDTAPSSFDTADDDDYALPGSPEPQTSPETLTDDDAVMGIDPVDQPISFHDPDSPDVLYSPLTGEAFGRGTPEFEEGFGPMGEELVESMPVDVEGAGAPAKQPFEEGEADLQEEPQSEDSATSDFEDELASASEPAPVVEKKPAFSVSGPNPAVALPKPGTHARPATLTLYHQKQPVLAYDIETDETLLGRRDIRADIHPDLDLAPYDPESFVSRKHAYIYRQNKNYTLYAISNAGVQLNSDLLELGERRALKDGDIVVIAGFLALKFQQGS